VLLLVWCWHFSDDGAEATPQNYLARKHLLRTRLSCRSKAYRGQVPCNKGGPGRPWRSDANVERVREAVLRDPRECIRRACVQVQMPPKFVWRVVTKRLHMKQYRLQWLEAQSYEKDTLPTFAFLGMISDAEWLMPKADFNDKATFYLRMWTLHNPRAFTGLEGDSPKVNVFQELS
jgi:hypothetical protein